MGIQYDRYPNGTSPPSVGDFSSFFDIANYTLTYNWTCPLDWDNDRNIVWMFGAGGGGGNSDNYISGSSYVRSAGPGGGSGAFAALYNLKLDPGTTYQLQLGCRGGVYSTTYTNNLSAYSGAKTYPQSEPTRMWGGTGPNALDITCSAGGNGASGYDAAFYPGLGGTVTATSYNADYIISRNGTEGGQAPTPWNSTTAPNRYTGGGGGAGAPGPMETGGRGGNGTETSNNSSQFAYTAGGGAGNFNDTGNIGATTGITGGAGYANTAAPWYAAVGGITGRIGGDGGYRNTVDWTTSTGLSQLDALQSKADTNNFMWDGFKRPFNAVFTRRYSRIANIIYGQPGGGASGGISRPGFNVNGNNYGAGGGGGGLNPGFSDSGYYGGYGGYSGIFMIWRSKATDAINFCM